MAEKPQKKFLRAFVKEKKLIGDDGEFSVFQIDVNAESFNTMKVNDAGFVQLTMRKKRIVGEKGDTHYITEWEPREPRQPKNDQYNEEGGLTGHASFVSAK